MQPKEVVVDTRLRGSKLGDRILELLEGERVREGIMVSTVSTDAVPSTSKDVPTVAASAEAVLLSYLATTLVSTPVPSASTTHIDDASVMHMDAVTLQSLEIRESLRGGVRGSLLGTVKRTVTPGGQRLLTERLCEDRAYVSLNQCLRADGRSSLQATRQRISQSSTLALTSLRSSSSAFRKPVHTCVRS